MPWRVITPLTTGTFPLARERCNCEPLRRTCQHLSVVTTNRTNNVANEKRLFVWETLGQNTRMKATTLIAIKAILDGDETLTPSDRKRAIQRLTQPDVQPETQTPSVPAPQPHDRVLTFVEAAKMLGKRSKKTAMNWADRGALDRVTLPGCKRASGVTESSVLALIQGRTA